MSRKAPTDRSAKNRSAAVPAASSQKAGEDAGATTNPTGTTVRTRGYLPHVEAPDCIYFITARLADSLPSSVLAELEARSKEDPSVDASDAIQQYLDAGSGACYLNDSRIAAVVREALQFFNGNRYRLLAWCIMPNHIHLLLSIHPDRGIADVMHALKSYTAHKANILLARRGAFWQHESYDHIVRDPTEYTASMNYIINNPSSAGLLDWPWSGYEGQDGQGAPHFYEATFTRLVGAASGHDAFAPSNAHGTTTSSLQDAGEDAGATRNGAIVTGGCDLDAASGAGPGL